MHEGGFDVIIGNPPYVEYAKVRKTYTIKGYESEACGNLYANMLERCSGIAKHDGICGVIVPLGGFSTERMVSYQNYLYSRFNSFHISFYSGDAHPSIIFNGVKHRLAIIMDDLRLKSKRRVYNYEHSGRVEYDEFYPKLSKSIIDEIDRVLAQHYGFTNEELDFIINYDIKYRMGRENGEEHEEEE
jgi:methylase of polypeptide subunit release factors